MGWDNRASTWMERRAGRVRAKKERAEKKAMIEEDPNKIINEGHRFLEREREMGQFREREGGNGLSKEGSGWAKDATRGLWNGT